MVTVGIATGKTYHSNAAGKANAHTGETITTIVIVSYLSHTAGKLMCIPVKREDAPSITRAVNVWDNLYDH